MHRIAALALLAAASTGGADEGPAAAGTVAFLSGEATRSAGERTEALAVGGRVLEGDLLETRDRTRLEVRLADGSSIRMGPASRVTLTTATFGSSPQDRKVSADLALGRIWAHVIHAVGGESRFEVRTGNAVAGVRGTAFEVEAAEDGSSAVRVWEGRVAVREPERGGAEGAPPAAGQRWERLLGPMTELRLRPREAPGQAARFDPAAAARGREEWQSWNRARDEERARALREAGRAGDEKGGPGHKAPGKRRRARER